MLDRIKQIARDKQRRTLETFIHTMAVVALITVAVYPKGFSSVYGIFTLAFGLSCMIWPWVIYQMYFYAECKKKQKDIIKKTTGWDTLPGRLKGVYDPEQHKAIIEQYNKEHIDHQHNAVVKEQGSDDSLKAKRIQMMKEKLKDGINCCHCLDKAAKDAADDVNCILKQKAKKYLDERSVRKRKDTELAAANKIAAKGAYDELKQWLLHLDFDVRLSSYTGGRKVSAYKHIQDAVQYQDKQLCMHLPPMIDNELKVCVMCVTATGSQLYRINTLDTVMDPLSFDQIKVILMELLPTIIKIENNK